MALPRRPKLLGSGPSIGVAAPGRAPVLLPPLLRQLFPRIAAGAVQPAVAPALFCPGRSGNSALCGAATAPAPSTGVRCRGVSATGDSGPSARVMGTCGGSSACRTPGSSSSRHGPCRVRPRPGRVPSRSTPLPPRAFRRQDPDPDWYPGPDPDRDSRAGSGSGSGSSLGWSANPVELVRREAGLQSNRLDGSLRERVEAAVERLGGRVTVGDVATRAGVKLGEADEALKALAYDTAASLQVSSEGDVVYGFPPDFRSRLRSRSLLVAAAPLARRAASVVSYLARVAFGSALIASVVVVWLAVAALLRGRDDDDRNRGRGGYGGGGYGGGYGYGGGGGGVRLWVDVTDLFLYWDPNYYRASAQRVASGSPLSFVESIFSFVFGDGDPNADWEERRWRQLGEMIRAKGGVVTAEEMAPYLDPPEPAPPPPPPSTGGGGAAAATGTEGEPYVPYPDESFVLPALIKFGGEPVVDESGRLLYRFPALQRTGVKQKRPINRFRREESTFEVPMERTWGFTAASPGQVAGTVFLGLLNLVGVGLLGGLMADPRAPYMLAMQGLGWLPGLMGPLQVYALAFFAIPAFRWLLLSRRNSDIESRNEAREAAAELLNGGGAAAASPAAAAALDDKLAAARRLGERADTGGAAIEDVRAGGGRGRLGPRLVSERDIVFDSGREAGPQAGESELSDWDARMAGRVAEEEARLRGRGRRPGGGGDRGGGSGGGSGAGWP